MDKKVIISFEVSQDTVDFIDKLKEKLGKDTRAEAIRCSLLLTNYLLDHKGEFKLKGVN